MVISHSFLASQLRPYLELSRQLEDILPAYALGMIIEHCDDVTMSKTAPITMPTKRKAYDATPAERLT